MIFSLDEELESLSLNKTPGNAIESDNESPIDDNFLPVSSKPIFGSDSRGRRRSSVYEKLQVMKPTGSKNLEIPTFSTSLSSSVISRGGVILNLSEDGNIGIKDLSRNINDFKPVRVLGKGAYGKVILVKDKKSKKLYAMKQLKKAEIVIVDDNNGNNNISDSETTIAHTLSQKIKSETNLTKRIERTFAEKVILSELEHPNIVKLFYAFHDHSKLYLILQYIPGGELFFHLKEQGTLNEDVVAFYGAEISCALKFLHEKGIVYRDLKPENCLLNYTGHLVLTDFGLSKKGVKKEIPGADEDVAELYSIIGTPEYCAPEILEGLPYTQNCDWYSLGCLIYDMLVGKPPFVGANHKIILNKIKKDKTGAKIPYYLSDGMKDILCWLLKKDCSKRWDVDKYWKESQHSKKIEKKNKKERVLIFQSHFIFRKINWFLMENGDLQRTSMGPIVPLITDWELAENFDEVFTSMSYTDDEFEMPSDTFENAVDIKEKKNMNDLFKGFSYKASGSYLERYF
ncbi:hypothetical protein TPHA_0A04170 [Tetrapisispora phaffii CBS 4417]|uniref:Protein kinase domain-containing protein n=1 Tax=Tetrapisispora phaffii (strain ATCC 24235 / CBS 4417 / NBRC 1672 / NRRL Y-8282 / UCD 70-5) TaxID=1071381 RepID=G8BNL4_TETPH|nr:hypothetical protein TPHA_0A04170 [Tetrapisispora phaffii CBS 4417]CCE61492.1 hypothetical protein TPHA_0A04170 [Tetrapisispora phaffii CBS 4417]